MILCQYLLTNVITSSHLQAQITAKNTVFTQELDLFEYGKLAISSSEIVQITATDGNYSILDILNVKTIIFNGNILCDAQLNSVITNQANSLELGNFIINNPLKLLLQAQSSYSQVCQTNQYLLAGSCTSECSSKFYDNSTWTCEDSCSFYSVVSGKSYCVASCPELTFQIASGEDSCSFYSVVSGKSYCVASCPELTFQIASGKKQCRSSCLASEFQFSSGGQIQCESSCTIIDPSYLYYSVDGSGSQLCQSTCSFKESLVAPIKCLQSCGSYPVDADSVCLTSCSPGYLLSGSCTSECSSKFYDNSTWTCQDSCSFYQIVSGKSYCVASCPELTFQIASGKKQCRSSCLASEFQFSSGGQAQCESSCTIIDPSYLYHSVDGSGSQLCQSTCSFKESLVAPIKCLQSCGSYPVDADSVCLTSCSPGYLLSGSCTSDCSSKFYDNSTWTCQDSCSFYQIVSGKSYCVASCPELTFQIVSEKKQCRSSCLASEFQFSSGGQIQCESSCTIIDPSYLYYSVDGSGSQLCQSTCSFKESLVAPIKCLQSCGSYPVDADSVCLTSCSPGYLLSGSCTSDCSSKFYDNSTWTCQDSCSFYQIVSGKSYCVASCPELTFQIVFGKKQCRSSCLASEFQFSSGGQIQCESSCTIIDPSYLYYSVDGSGSQLCQSTCSFKESLVAPIKCLQSCGSYPVDADSVCLTSCSPGYLLSGSCTSDCSSKFYDNSTWTCQDSCSFYQIVSGKSYCVASCPELTFQIVSGKKQCRSSCSASEFQFSSGGQIQCESSCTIIDPSYLYHSVDGSGSQLCQSTCSFKESLVAPIKCLQSCGSYPVDADSVCLTSCSPGYLLSGSCTSDCSSKFYDNSTWTCQDSCSFYQIVSGKSYCVASCPELTFQIVSGKKQCRSSCLASEFQFSSGGQIQCESSCTIIDPSYLYHSVDGSGSQLCQSTCSFKESLVAPIKCLQSCGSYPVDADSVCLTSCSPGYLLSGSCTSDCSSKFYDNSTWTCQDSCSFYQIVSGKSYCVASCPELTFQIVFGKKQCRSSCLASEFQFSSGGQIQCESSCTIIDPSYLYYSVDGSGSQLCQSTCSFKESLVAPIKCLQSCGSYPVDADSVCLTSCSPGYLLSGSCTSECSSKFYDNSTWTCQDSCSFYQIVSGKSYCVASCPELTFQIVSGKKQCRSSCLASEFQFSSGGQIQCESSCTIIDPSYLYHSVDGSGSQLCQSTCSFKESLVAPIKCLQSCGSYPVDADSVCLTSCSPGYLLSGSCTSDCSSKFYDNSTWTCQDSCSFYQIVSGKSYCVASCPELTFQIASGKKQCRSSCLASEFQFSSGGQIQCESSCTIIDPSYLYHSVDGSGSQLCQSTCSFKESLVAPIKCLQSCGSYPVDADSVCLTSCSPGYLLSGSCTSDCSSKFYDNSTWTCQDSCSFYQIVSGKSYCVASCPELTFQIASGKKQCRSSCLASEFQFSSGGQIQCESSCKTINPLFLFYSVINSMNICQQLCDSLTVQPTVQRCEFCAYILFEGNCVQNCPDNFGYDVFSSQCVNCTHVDGFCVMDCPVKINGICQEWKYEQVKGSEYVLLGGVSVLGLISVILTGIVVGKWCKARPIRMRATDMGAGI
ncbi:P-selectin-like_isoform X1 [Hexamita inflata]|uniref:P-selectin-like_isoform X1 n=1 Tax=Hexamita inflata TaxID=28002 RepID=A0ABP1HYX3_9EUKA